MKKVSTLKLNLMRAAMTLALIMTCATAWAQTTETVSYIDANGQTQTVTATVLTSSETSLDAGWYVAKGTLNFTHCLRLSNGDVTLILADGCSMNVGTSTNRIDDDAFSGFSGQTHYSLDIYGQTLGTGALSVYSTGDYHDAVRFNAITINGGNVTADTEGIMGIGICAVSGGITINGGIVNAIATGISSSGLNSYGNGTITLGWTRATDHIYASSYKGTVSVAPGLAFLTDDDPAQQVSGTITDLSLINGKTLTPDVSSGFSVSADGNTYTIWNAYGWGLFCDAIAGGESFSGKTVYLGADITITRMACDENHKFNGTFNGQGHTLTVNYGSADNPIDTEFVAPFVCSGGNPVFLNLNIDGHIYDGYTGSEAHNVGGLIGHLFGDVTIEHCTSNVEIINSSGGAGGFVGLCEHTVNFNDCMSSNVIHSAGGNNSGFVSWSRASGFEINFTGCVFNGKLLQINGEGHSNGGFIGWTGSNKTVSITNCLYAPAALAEGEAYASYNSATFARGWNGTTTAPNSYYTTDFNDGTHYTGQGKQAYSITAGDNVTVANAGTPVNVYNTSGITSYGTGIKYNNVLYAGNEETISLTLGNTPPTYYGLTGYTTTGGTLTGNSNPYTLTMPNENVIIGATFELQPVSVTYIDENGQQQTHDALPLLGGGATTLAAGWYVVNSDISYTGTVSLGGSVNLILADDHTMNVGTSENRIEYGIRTYNNAQTLTIYGQSTGNHMGILSVYSSDYCIYPVALTINGGHVIANADGNYATALRTTYQPITINGGTVEATATGNGADAIHAADNFTYAGGTLITNAASGNAIYASYKCYTFTWRNPNDSITIGSTGFYDDNGSATATFTKAFTDGTNIYSGTLRGSELNALAGKTLHPVTAYKTITAHSTPEQPVSGWYLIASPVGDVSAMAVNNLITTESDYDLYYFDQTGGTNGLEWKNYKAHHEDATNPFNALVSGQGYLYANSANVNLIFTGTPYSGPCEITLTKATDAGIDFSGWNLVGNPFNETAYIDKTDFYRMNEEGSEIEVATDNAIAPMEGIFVLAGEDGETMTFSAQETNKGHSEKPKPEQIVLNLSSNGGSVIDRAIVRMGEGGTLPKFQIRESSTKLYIPQGGKDYAIVSVGNVSEIPVNFKAEENGTYTLTVSPTLNSQLSTLNYLHLIDNMTGADIDLIPSLRAVTARHEAGSNPEPPVSYTFTAKTTDYESRFKLVFIANDASTGSASDATFAFVSNGNLIVNGEGTLQVIDLMGRVIRTVGLSPCGSRTSTAGMTPCVYVLRLINGDNVRTQKIVIP